MRQAVSTAIRWLERLLDAAAALLLVGVLAVTAARVVSRYLIGEALPWSEELTRLLFVWLVLIGAARCAHLRVDLLSGMLAPAPAAASSWQPQRSPSGLSAS
ncbi:TRAP transporter small permease subunit [Kaustia mangrovi]|uniref:TRAP transporter small permease protein n=1 Tax=Kaustia mangrovi TaxID=2593653 RepID=A0A7S8C3K7_9HYPH|nr:TRAP transporter small permease subunit [Kaustia mangrovi]